MLWLGRLTHDGPRAEASAAAPRELEVGVEADPPVAPDAPPVEPKSSRRAPGALRPPSVARAVAVRAETVQSSSRAPSDAPATEQGLETPPTTPAVAFAAPARFTMFSALPPVARGLGSNDAALTAPREAVYEARDVSEPARLVQSAEAPYPEAASAAGIEADVTLELVVDENGRVTSATPRTGAGYGFERAAETAVRAYRFSPARRAGRPVRVRLSWTVNFRLR
jgi:TonB family protein